MSVSLAKKLAAVMMAVDKVAKRGRNDFHKYDYATESDIVFAVREKLAEQHVVLVPAVTKFHREAVGEKGFVLTHLEMEFTFIDGESGEQISRAWLGAGADKEDKGVYKAMTGAEKYFLLKTFLIPTGDDPEASEGDGQPTRNKQAKRDAGRTTPQQVEAVRERLQESGPEMITKDQRKHLGEEAKRAGWDVAHVKGWLASLGYADSTKIPVSNYDDILSAIQAGPALAVVKGIEDAAAAAQGAH